MTVASSSLEIEARCQTCAWRWSPPGPKNLERDGPKVRRKARQHGRAHRGHIAEAFARAVTATQRGPRVTMLDVEITCE